MYFIIHTLSPWRPRRLITIPFGKMFADQCVPNWHQKDIVMCKLIDGGDLFKVMDHFDITGDPDRLTIDSNGRQISPILAAAAAGRVRMVEFFASRGATLTEMTLQTLNLSTWGTCNPALAELYGYYARDRYDLEFPFCKRELQSPAHKCWVDHKLGRIGMTPIHVFLANISPHQ